MISLLCLVACCWIAARRLQEARDYSSRRGSSSLFTNVTSKGVSVLARPMTQLAVASTVRIWLILIECFLGSRSIPGEVEHEYGAGAECSEHERLVRIGLARSQCSSDEGVRASTLRD